MLNSYLLFWQNAFDFSGKTTRKDYWLAYLAQVILLLIGVFFAVFIYLPEVIFFFIVLASVIPNLSITVRRLHDIDKPWYYILVNYIPFIGSIWLIILMATESNRFSRY